MLSDAHVYKKMTAKDTESLTLLNKVAEGDLSETKNTMVELKTNKTDELRYTDRTTHMDRNHIKLWSFMDATVMQDYRLILHMMHCAYQTKNQFRKTKYYIAECKEWMTGRGYVGVMHWIDIVIASLVIVPVKRLKNYDDEMLMSKYNWYLLSGAKGRIAIQEEIMVEMQGRRVHCQPASLQGGQTSLHDMGELTERLLVLYWRMRRTGEQIRAESGQHCCCPASSLASRCIKYDKSTNI